MDLISLENRTLLRNCLLVRLKQLQLDMNSRNQALLEYYSYLLELLSTNDAEKLIGALKSSYPQEDFLQFNNHILSASEKELVTEHLDIVNSLLPQNDKKSIDKLSVLKNVFYPVKLKTNSNNEKTKNSIELEEEPEKDPLDSLPLSLKLPLAKLRSLTTLPHKNRLSASELKNWASEFSEISKAFGILKFQEHFKEKGQTIADMQITYNKSSEQTMYTTDFKLLDSQFEESHFEYKEPVANSLHISNYNYYQALCYSYLEGQKLALSEENTLSEDTFANFLECYKKLVELGNVKINIAKNPKDEPTIIYSSISHSAPEHELDSSCSNGKECEEREV